MLKELINVIWKPLTMSLITIIGVALLPNKNLISINALILIMIYITDLLTFKTPDLKRWFNLTWKTIVWVSSFILFFQLLGSWGIIGLIIGLVCFVAFRIYQQWELYDYTTSWGAKVLFGGSKEEFNISEVKTYAKSKPEEIRSGSIEDSQPRRNSSSQGESEKLASGLSSDESFVPILQAKSNEQSDVRFEISKGDSLSSLPVDVSVKGRRRKKTLKEVE